MPSNKKQEMLRFLTWGPRFNSCLEFAIKLICRSTSNTYVNYFGNLPTPGGGGTPKPNCLLLKQSKYFHSFFVQIVSLNGWSEKGDEKCFHPGLQHRASSRASIKTRFWSTLAPLLQPDHELDSYPFYFNNEKTFIETM